MPLELLALKLIEYKPCRPPPLERAIVPFWVVVIAPDVPLWFLVLLKIVVVVADPVISGRPASIYPKLLSKTC